MLTRKRTLSKAALLTGLVVTLGGQAALAADEVVVYGGDAAERARAAEAEFQARMSENAESLNRTIKANVEKEIEKLKLPKLQLALGEVANRG